jgi:hypothetical protein
MNRRFIGILKIIQGMVSSIRGAEGCSPEENQTKFEEM